MINPSTVNCWQTTSFTHKGDLKQTRGYNVSCSKAEKTKKTYLATPRREILSSFSDFQHVARSGTRKTHAYIHFIHTPTGSYGYAPMERCCWLVRVRWLHSNQVFGSTPKPELVLFWFPSRITLGSKFLTPSALNNRICWSVMQYLLLAFKKQDIQTVIIKNHQIYNTDCIFCH